jgi:hypothetical protein
VKQVLDYKVVRPCEISDCKVAIPHHH